MDIAIKFYGMVGTGGVGVKGGGVGGGGAVSNKWLKFDSILDRHANCIKRNAPITLQIYYERVSMKFSG